MDNECVRSVKSGWRRFTLMEPPLFLLLLAYGMTATVLTDLIVYQTCRQMMVTNKNSCDIFHTNSSSHEAKELDKIVQPHASYIIMCKSLIEGIFPALLVLFVGPWSDKYGRKPLLVVGYFAPICTYTLLSILSHLDISPWMFLLASVPAALLGGISVLLLGVFCYVSDISEPEKRAWYLGCLEACLSAGLVIGIYIGPLIFQKYGYALLFIIATLISVLSLLHVLFFVPETIKNESNKWGNPFDISLVKQLILTCTKKRPGLNRGLLWSCVLVLSFLVIIMDGTANVKYLFTSAKLGWNTVQFSVYTSLSMTLTIVGTIVGLKVMRNYLGLKDVTGTLIGCSSGFAAAIVYSFTSKPWHMYLGTSLGIFTGMISPTARSVLSKSAPIDDLGKVFSLVTFMEALLPLGGASLYSLIYSLYMSVYPLPVFLLSAGINFLMIIITIIMDWKFNTYESPYQSAIQED
ncbi:proton-coupled folate transporter-like [Microplitis mediator]|uniref:proton-coupled folate transporter-like n=1 Tax=Microplitis mediator TaxID=375433 RepID=UPI0025565B2F|nr:proton-coupled folate transporter-like [Microplitis mediator]